MALFLFRCPNTGMTVQGWSAEEIAADRDSYEAATCAACGQFHFVNKNTGRVLGSEREQTRLGS